MKNKKLISIVFPVYNEEKIVPKLISEVNNFIKKNPKYNFEIILVENGSTDNTFDLLQKHIKDKKQFKIVQLSRNFKVDGGIEAGLKYVSGDACVIMMADLQEPLAVVKQFLKKWEDGYEIVYGVVKKRTASLTRNLSSILFYKIINLLTNNAFPDNVSDFRLIDKKIVLLLNKMPEKNKYLRGLIIWLGFSHIGVDFDRQERFAGKSKMSFSSALQVAINGIFSFSNFPLRLIAFLGASLSLLSLAGIIFYLGLFLISGRAVPGFFTIVLIILFLFSMLFLALGIMSEYLGRIYEEVKNRPTHVVKQLYRLKAQ